MMRGSSAGLCGGACRTYGSVSGCSVGAAAARPKRLPPMPPRSVWLGVGEAGVHPHPSHPTPPPLLTLQVWRGHRPRSGRLPVRGDRLLPRPLRGNPAWVARLRLVDGRRFGARPEWNTGCALSLELVLHVGLAAEPNKKKLIDTGRLDVLRCFGHVLRCFDRRDD